jgi:PAS domain S-box-containing protein
MEGGLIPVLWFSVALLLACAAGLAFAYDRLHARLEQEGRKRAGMERIVEQANDAIIVLDFVSGRIYHANPSAAAMLGHSVDALQGMTVFDLHFPEDLHRSAERIADVWGKGGLVYDDIPFRTHQGGRLPVECSGKVTEYQGKPAVVIHARDIAERLRLQQEVAEQSALVEQQNLDMRSGLRYARGIQQGMLPSLDELRASFADAFVINRPRDIVSGDFHWSARIGDKVVVAVADCTGHGVPGAMLSMTGIALLQQVVGRGIIMADRILMALRAELLRTLAHQEGEGEIQDGMTIGLVVRDLGSGNAEYAGSLCPLYILRKGATDLEEIKGDRVPIGFHDGSAKTYERHALQLGPGDRLYMGSDGFADQFGGPDGRKLQNSALKRLLSTTGPLSMDRQQQALETAFEDWRGEQDQVDDVLLIGLQV